MCLRADLTCATGTEKEMRAERTKLVNLLLRQTSMHLKRKYGQNFNVSKCLNSVGAIETREQAEYFYSYMNSNDKNADKIWVPMIINTAIKAIDLILGYSEAHKQFIVDLIIKDCKVVGFFIVFNQLDTWLIVKNGRLELI